MSSSATKPSSVASKKFWGMMESFNTAVQKLVSKEQESEHNEEKKADTKEDVNMMENEEEKGSDNDISSLWVLISKIPAILKPQPPKQDEDKPSSIKIGPQCEEYLKLLLENHYHRHPSVAPIKVPLAQCNVNSLLTPTLITQILSFLPIESLLSIQAIDDQYFTLANQVLYNRQYLRKCARRGFYNRPLVWPWLISDSMDKFCDIYVEKLAQWRAVENGEMDKVEELKQTYHSLQKDIGRTFSNNRFMTLSDEQMKQMQTILGVYSLYDPEIDYVQGMNFVAGTIVFAVGDELDAFGVFCELMKWSPLKHNVSTGDTCSHCNGNGNGNDNDNDNNVEEKESGKEEVNYAATYYSHSSGGRVSKTGQKGYGLRFMFSKALPACVVALAQFENLLQQHIPTLFDHLRLHEIDISSFTSEWFITLFSYVLPLAVTFRVFDLFLVDGFKALHRVGLAILSCTENHLLMLESDDILMYLKQFPDSGMFLNSMDEEDGDTFIRRAMSFKITNYQLHQFCTRLVAEK